MATDGTPVIPTPKGRQALLLEIVSERMRQEAKWGTKHDDEHDWEEWAQLLFRLIEEADNTLLGPEDDLSATPRWRKHMIEVAATALAAVEAYDRRQRKEGGVDTE
jgi:hypothetical protein